MASFMEVLRLLTGFDPELRRIISATLVTSFSSTLIACGIGIPAGILIGITRFRGRRLVVRITHTFMGFPPVIAGIVVFFLLSRSGPLGHYKLLYSIPAMIFAQVLIITPIAAGLAISMSETRADMMRETALGINLSAGRRFLYTVYEARKQLFSILFTGFGRAVSEVGAAQIVGGNIQNKTRVMTTAIVLETNKGDFELALALGILLLLISFLITSLAQFLQEGINGRNK